MLYASTLVLFIKQIIKLFTQNLAKSKQFNVSNKSFPCFNTLNGVFINIKPSNL